MAKLESYEVMVEDGQVRWLSDRPTVKSARAIVTILADSARPEDREPRKPEIEGLMNLGGTQPQLEPIPRRREPADS